MTLLLAPFDASSTAEIAVVVGGYLFLLLTSGVVVTGVLDRVPTATEAEPTEKQRDVGTIVGKCENVLTVTFMLLGAYTALAVIFAAKGIVRRDDIEKNSLFYLAGTLVNFTYSVAVGALTAVGLAWL